MTLQEFCAVFHDSFQPVRVLELSGKDIKSRHNVRAHARIAEHVPAELLSCTVVSVVQFYGGVSIAGEKED